MPTSSLSCSETMVNRRRQGGNRRWGHGRGRGARAVATAVVLWSALWLGPGAGQSVRAAENASPIKADEEVVFFPGFATESAPLSWTAHVHGWIFEPKGKPGQLSTLGTLLQEKVRLTKEELASTFFRERARMFLVDNERKKSLSVTVSGRTVTLAPSKE